MVESVQSNHESMHSEAIPPQNPPERVGTLIDVLLSERIVQGMSANQRASVAWYACNGDRERAHTTRVFLRQSQVAGADPIICVYVDSHAFLTDLNANKDLYLARLANGGYYVSGIQFAVDREISARRTQAKEQSTLSRQEIKKTVSAELEQHVQDMVRDLPESLQGSISKAILASCLQDGRKVV